MLLLPTRQYLVGGTLIVALSFVLVLWLRPARSGGAAPARWRLALPRIPALLASSLSLALLAALLLAGWFGSRDPLANPLPTLVWSAWWVGLTLLHALAGNLWAWLHPWHALHALLRPLHRARPRLHYPAKLGCSPALAVFAAFAWFELVYPAPQDPAILAWVLLAYLLLTATGMALFGKTTWLNQGEAFCVFFRMVGWLAPLSTHRAGHRIRLQLHLPARRLLAAGPLPAGRVAFVLLVLASVSFDGLSKTFWWLQWWQVNPLEHPGRTALVGANTFGLLATFILFALLYLGVTRAQAALSGIDWRGPAHTFVLSIVPIAFGYHFAHYLPAFLVDVQYALRALSDPWALGWDLFGTAGRHVVSSFLTHHRPVTVIWNLQTAAIVIAHLFAVAVGHRLAARQSPPSRLALGQLPPTALMIAYTLFGLWLLATPTAG